MKVLIIIIALAANVVSAFALMTVKESRSRWLTATAAIIFGAFVVITLLASCGSAISALEDNSAWERYTTNPPDAGYCWSGELGHIACPPLR